MSVKYGELIVLGDLRYNGSHGKCHYNILPQSCRYALLQRAQANGISKFRDYTVEGRPDIIEHLRLSSKKPLNQNHTVTYTLDRYKSVVVEYKPDENFDIFQVGRSSESQIDFTVVDTRLGAWTSWKNDYHRKSIASERVSHQNEVIMPIDPNFSPSQSTISRYACRILIDRRSPYKACVYAAGFDSSKNIFLGEKATKWHRKNGQIDGLTTNGVLILQPEFSTSDMKGIDEPMYVWHEVSVDGDVYTLRETRSSPLRGSLVDTTRSSNQLSDGTLIDLCGATVLFRSGEGLASSPTPIELEQTLNKLNAGRPVCPVNLNTLVIPKHKGDPKGTQPCCYPQCGHVQGNHAWGHKMDTQKHRCPMCNTESDEIIQLTMGMEPTFHLDSSALNFAFNSCGHVASEKTVKYWSRIPLPHGTNQFHPVCPFCTEQLNPHKPYVKLIFQDNIF